MLIFSLKTSKRKILTYIVIIFAVISLFSMFFFLKPSGTHASCPSGKYKLNAKDNDERIEFLSQFGWEVNNEPTEITDITIPSEFNATYEKYNDIQREQGLDLSKYREKTCTRYTYQILNYNDCTQGIRANILVLNGKVIGGDISSIKLNGFIHGFFDTNKINT